MTQIEVYAVLRQARKYLSVKEIQRLTGRTYNSTQKSVRMLHHFRYLDKKEYKILFSPVFKIEKAE